MLSDGVGTITKLASLFWIASLASIVADRRCLVGGDQLVELRLDDRHLAGVQRIDQHLVDVEADHGEAAAGEHRGERRTKLAEADDLDARESC